MQIKHDFDWLLLRLGSSRWRIVVGLLWVSLAGLAATAGPVLLQLPIDRA